MPNKKTKIAYLGLLTALAMVLSYLELLIPPIFTAVPGIKMGLANIVIVFCLYCFGFRYALAISLVRVFAVSLLFSNVMIMIYSLAGALLSLLLMWALKKTDRFSYVSVSVVGGVAHNLGQIIVAIFVLKTIEIGYYMIVLTATGAIAGILVGLVSALLIKKVAVKKK